ncbi:S1 RNA binding domain-containing protein [Thermoactinomyces sp. DSM 45891]|uniref:S1 RNA-binding domain-containing protein n=1 Tax=Thermoactinomyces sp. DSM 45891 TaxID=1761907 RepID=UPI00091544B2|nr:S1 RNA-binding domain-containing protein [Thermoactinomyces sp. DSM 45891]SFX46163.1 S1 RNA binding domain-containing protein [Thermoactinomyces sp. DSM 45891]
MAEKSLDERIEEFTQQTSLATDLAKPPPYNVGDYIDATITFIASYGAFVELEGGKYSGLIHIKNIANQYIEDIHDFLEVGMTINAKIIRIHSDFRIELSTLHLNLKKTPQVNENRFYLSPLEKLKNGLPTGDDIIESSSAKPPEEIQRIFNYLSKVVGILSPESKEKVQSLVNEKGVFAFTMSLVEALKVFEADLSLYLVKEIEKQMRDDL